MPTAPFAHEREAARRSHFVRLFFSFPFSFADRFFFSFIHSPSCLQLCHVSHLSHHPRTTCLPHATCRPSSHLCHAAPFRSRTRGATLQPPSAFFSSFSFSFSFADFPFFSHVSLLFIPFPHVVLLPLFLALQCDSTPPPSPRSGTPSLPRLGLGRDVTRHCLTLWDALFIPHA